MTKRLLPFFTMLITVSAFGQWAGNTNLTPATTGGKGNLVSIPDGAGGMFMAWDDTRNSATTGTDIFAQRISNSGTLLWTSTGVQACNTAGNQTGPVLCSDGAGGIILAWIDAAGNQDIFVQRINANGQLLYGPGGMAFSANATNLENRPTLALLNGTEAFLMFADDRNDAISMNSNDIFANKINIATGAKVFPSDVSIAAVSGSPTFFNAVPDGSGGAYMVWQDPRISTSGADIFVQRMNNNGTLQAGSNGLNITPLTSAGADNQLQPYAIGDGTGNLFVTWQDQRLGNTNGDIFVQKLSSSLVEAWTAKGVNICNATGSQSNPYCVPDGAGGLIATWSDPRVATNDRNIYAQRVNSLGAPQWAANGVDICTATGNQPGSSTQSDIFIVADGAGGAVIAWGDVRNGAATGSSSNMDIYAQKVNAAGVIQWAINGIDLVNPTGSGNQRQPVLVGDGFGSVLISWIDSRSGPANGDIYGAKILADGTLPLLFISISGSINGNLVIISFTTAQEQNLANMVIEKSVDGSSFTNISTTKPLNSIRENTYKINDNNPVKGNNYYRVRAVDKDGSVHYSPIAIVNYNQKIRVEWNLYPIPATSFMTLRITNATHGNYSLSITGVGGQQMAQKSITISNSLFTQNLDISRLGKGIYFTKLVNAKGETVWMSKMIKE